MYTHVTGTMYLYCMSSGDCPKNMQDTISSVSKSNESDRVPFLPYAFF